MLRTRGFAALRGRLAGAVARFLTALATALARPGAEFREVGFARRLHSGLVTSSRLSSTRIEATYCFIDLAGFTALTEAQGDEDAADVAARFAEHTRAALGPGDRLVKTIGDAVLITSQDAMSGVSLVERVHVEVANEPDFPALRAGLHHGEAVWRDADVFGAAVNLAARVAAEAHPGEVLGTERIAEAARAQGIPVADLGDVLLKNVRGHVRLFSLAVLVGATETPIDPVCRMPVDRRGAAGRLRYRDTEYWFCSLTCAAAFASNPGWHAAEAAKSR